MIDVGGGTGVYALPLAARGYQVHLVDPVPLHVERVRELSAASASPLAGIELGDARKLAAPDESCDAVLMLGPLYHLTDRGERIAALAEARRVLVPGGLLLSAYISRFASACDGIRDGMLMNEGFAAIVDRDLADGIHRNAAQRPDWFTTAYFHRPEEIRPEVEDAGLRFERLLAVEGPFWLGGNVEGFLAEERARARLFAVLRRLESEPALLGASAHLIASARR